MDGSNQEKALVLVAESRQMKSSEETREVKLHRVDENPDSNSIMLSLEDSKNIQIDCQDKNIMLNFPSSSQPTTLQINGDRNRCYQDCNVTVNNMYQQNSSYVPEIQSPVKRPHPGGSQEDNEFKRSRESFADSPAERQRIKNDNRMLLIEHLWKKYEDVNSSMTPVPRRRAQRWHIKKLFVDIGVSILDQTKSSRHAGSWNSLKTYKALFTSEHLAEAKRIVIEGDPGCGKTTLMHQLAYLWCSKVAPMDKVDIFVLLSMNEMKPGWSIHKAIKETLLPTDCKLEAEDIEDILKDGSCKVLALDGLDEYSGRTAERYMDEDVVKDLMKGRSLSRVKILLTTRKSCVSDLYNCSVARVRLDGFQWNQHCAYVRNVLDGEDGSIQKFWKLLSENDILESLMAVPRFFVGIPHVIRDMTGSLADFRLDTATGAFRCIEPCLAHCRKVKRYPGRAKTSNKRPCEESASLICERAFEGLVTDCRSWRVEELHDDPGYVGLIENGVLVEEEEEEEEVDLHGNEESTPMSVRFMKDRFQEWFGAKYLSGLAESEPELFAEKLEQIDPNSLQHLLRFTCGLNPTTVRPILEKCLQQVEGKPLVDIFCLCLHEHSGDKTPLMDLIKMICAEKFDFSLSHHGMLHQATASLFRYASDQQIEINRVTIRSRHIKETDNLVLPSGVHLQPLPTARKIKLNNWPGKVILPWLKRCASLQTLKIVNDTPFPAEDLWEIFHDKQTKVVLVTYGMTFELAKGKWMVYHDRSCDGCLRGSILGDRFRCTECQRYNLCRSCKMEGLHPDHAFTTFSGIERRHQYKCDGCKESPIIGTRFRCWTCLQFNLCEICKDRNIHSDHQFKEFSGEEARNSQYTCSECQENPIVGSYYRCKTCASRLYFCQCCMQREGHSDHGVYQFNGSEPPHLFVRCDNCGERPVRGKLFKCKDCIDYKLCECCWDRQVHPGHEFEVIIRQTAAEVTTNSYNL
ncbi:uncharacterized protein [Apostichopus japonicus]